MTSDYAFHIEPAVCLEAYGQIDAAANRMRALLEEIDQDGQRLLAGWDGDAQEAFRARQRQWHVDAEAILLKLGEINASLQKSVGIYTEADRRGANLIAEA